MPVEKDITFQKNVLLSQLKKSMDAVEAARCKDTKTFTYHLDLLIQNANSLIQNPVHKNRLITYLLARFKHNSIKHSITVTLLTHQDCTTTNYQLSDIEI